MAESKLRLRLFDWTLIAPVVAWVLFAGHGMFSSLFYSILLFVALIASVMAAVHHAEVVAHRVGEPYGALILAIAVTTIEVGLIISLMLAPGHASPTLARDTVFAAEMIIITGIVGACLLLGGLKHGEQTFSLDGANAALTVLITISVFTLILPNYTLSTPGPFYNDKQLAFVAIVSLVLYGTFILIQTIWHRNYFLLKEEEPKEARHNSLPTNKAAVISAVFLLISLAVVILLAESLAPGIEAGIDRVGAPKSMVGIIIAMIVLLPEGIAALQAAKSNRLQSSLNLALGSALASIGLSIPAVAFVSIYKGLPLTLGLDTKSTLLYLLSLFIILLSLRTGRTTLLQGVVLLVVFAVYIFITIVP